MDIDPLLKEIFAKRELIEASFSAPSRAKIKPIAIKNQWLYQLTETKENKAFHRNLTSEEALDTILTKLLPLSKESIFYTPHADWHVIHGKLHKKKGSKTLKSAAHNRVKETLVPLAPLPFLVELGVVKPSGGLVPAKADKFRQINRFLELVRDVLPDRAPLHIVDFGCGKGYLTFALHYWLTEVLKKEVKIIGIDLKKEVVENLTLLAKNLNCQNLQFVAGDIKDYRPKNPIDMVIALHACNTATDLALFQAIQWKADVILAAPCCHQELYSQIQNQALDSLFQHGILREKVAALATDALRADLLEIEGYRTQVIEFVDPEHTPKNLMIRAVKGSSAARIREAKERYRACKAALQAKPTLEKLLSKKKD